MKVVTGFILGWVVLAVAALLVVYSGSYDVAASKPENTITAWLFSTTMRRSVAHHADAAATPGPSTEDQVRQGFKLYNETCVYCHGAPGKDPVDIGKGLNPEPPYLADTVGAHDQINNLFHLRRKHLPASQYRAARTQAFQTWAAVTGGAARA